MSNTGAQKWISMGVSSWRPSGVGRLRPGEGRGGEVAELQAGEPGAAVRVHHHNAGDPRKVSG